MVSPELLRRLPYFAKIADASLKQVAMIADEKFYPAETLLFREGDPAETLNVILEGEVRIQYLLGNEEMRTVDTLVSGDILIWSAIVEPHKTTAYGTTSKPTKVLSIKAKELRDLCEKDALLGYRLMQEIAKLLAHRLQNARVQLATM